MSGTQGGRGGGRGGRGRGGGGPPGQGQPQQMAFRGGPQGDRGGRGGYQGRGGPQGGRGGFSGGGRGGGASGGEQGGIYLAGAPVPAPDARITNAENSLIAATRGRMFDLGTEGAIVPGRRGYGTKGRPIVLRTNYFPITTAYEASQEKNEKTLYRYDVSVQPEQGRQKTRRVFDKLMTHAKFTGVTWATDYAKYIVTTSMIDLGGEEWKEKLVIPPVDPTPPGAQQGPPPAFVVDAQTRNTVRVTVKLNDSYAPRQMIDYLRSNVPGAQYLGAADLIQIFNIIMCKPPNAANSVKAAGGNRFYPYEGHPGIESGNLGAGLEALRGYFSSVRPAVGRMLLNLNVTSGAFHKPMPLNALINEFGGRTNEQREAFIQKLKVRAIYKKPGQPDVIKTKTIVGFARETNAIRVKRFGNANEVKFSYVDHKIPNAQPQQVTVFNYFKNHHGITLQNPGLPVINVGTRPDPQYLPIEICTVVPGQQYNRFLGGDQTTAMLGFAARFPNQNAMSIAGNGQRLFRLRDPTGGPDPQVLSVQPFGFRVGVDMITVPGRVLNSPVPKYANKNVRPNGGSWNCAGTKFTKPGSFKKWQVLVINRRGNRGNALTDPNPEGLFSTVERELKAYGLSMGTRAPTQTIMIDALSPENRPTNSRTLEQAFRSAQGQGAQLLLIILPEFDRWLYSEIKLCGDVKFGIHTINSIGQKLQKPNGQGMYIGNLALKFNIKGGGVNHVVDNTFSAKPLDKSTMLMGIDVTHPSPGSSEGAPSIACLVASIDEHLTQFPGSIRAQTGRVEMVQGLEAMVIERLNLWQKKHNAALPSKIILYRDGVSEGQYDLVLRQELPSFYEAFKKKYGAKEKWPKMAVIIVGKRHHTRFYPTTEQDADSNRNRASWNPLPGTIVDRHIGGRILSEFWLQAHQGLQGTARSAHYVVIKDDLEFEPDVLHEFTHTLCYLFNRAPKAVSICPPAYYADLLCERGRNYLYTVLAENHGSESSVFNANQSWTGGVHRNLEESTFYI